jgi:hypothetical protein
MIRVGFIVEGDSEVYLVCSAAFQETLQRYGLELCKPVINARGGGNICERNIVSYIDACQQEAKPDRIIVLTDLECEPCFTMAKTRINRDSVDAIVVARKALESWFLADEQALCQYFQHDDIRCALPEETPGKPWDYLKERTKELGLSRGPGATRKIFARNFVQQGGFSLERAAQHPHCPSARYFLNALEFLGTK